VAVLERGALAAQTSPRAAGLSSQVRATPALTRLAQRAVAKLAAFADETGQPLRFTQSGALKIARTVLVFSLMTLASQFFRGNSLSHTWGVVSHTATGWEQALDLSSLTLAAGAAGLDLSLFVKAALMIGFVMAIQAMRAKHPLRPRIAALPAGYRWAVYYAAAVAVLLLGGANSQPFIYFQF